MLLIPILSLLLPFSSVAQADLVIVVEGLRNSEGKVLAGLSHRAEGFPDEAVIGKVSRISGNTATIVFENLKPGRYALAIIHDENNNRELDTNALGVPREGFGFGNNAMGVFGPPSFKRASVVIRNARVTQTLWMRYF